MEISISKAISHVFSSKYNKSNIFIYVLLSFVLFGIYFTTYFLELSGDIVISAFTAYLVMLLLNYGYFTTLTHNQIHKKEQVMPSISEIKTLAKNGFLFLVGNLGISIIFSIIVLLYSIIFLLFGTIIVMSVSKININEFSNTTEGAIIICSLLLIFIITYIALTLYIFYAFLMPLYLRFFTTLEIEDLFNVTEAIEFKKRRKNLYGIFVIKHILLNILITIFAILITSIITILSYKLISNVDYELQFNIIITIFAILFIILQTLFIPCINAQIVGELSEEEIASIKENSDSEEFCDFDEEVETSDNIDNSNYEELIGDVNEQPKEE